jgi:hypothetical protein
VRDENDGSNVRYVEAPHPLYDVRERALFLAGGITNCVDWQSDVVTWLRDQRITVLNPRRPNFDVGNRAAAYAQVAWEHRHLRLADVILFWFPASGDVAQPIALYELGYWVNSSKQLAVGAHPDYVRRYDVELQVKLTRPAQVIHGDLMNTVADAVELLKW